ncbi:uncharacterized protein METZ01_LOCUS197920 [marine metagenome]|uniref:Uncharacterized protein n=1 Tax=marine metagenome TaxID=408172 RepID=A0A382E2R5_9ZZZZ
MAPPEWYFDMAYTKYGVAAANNFTTGARKLFESKCPPFA